MNNYMLSGNRFKIKQALLLAVLISSFTLLDTTRAMAQGDLMLFPKRIIFEGSKRSQEINLANSGKDTARYILSVVQIRMKEDGSFENITEPDPGQNFADKYFRIFQRIDQCPKSTHRKTGNTPVSFLCFDRPPESPGPFYAGIL